MFSGIGKFCVRHRRFVLAGSLLLFVACILVGPGVFMHLKESNGSSAAESVQGARLIDAASSHGPGMVAVVDGPRVGDLAVRRAVLRAAARVANIGGVTGVVTAYDSPDPMLRSADGRASLIVISTAKTGDMMRMHQEVADVRQVLSGSVPGATVKVGGALAVMRDQAVSAQSDLLRGELIALPILLLALLLVFRGLRAALMPVLGALVTAAGALLLLRAVTGVIDVSGYAVDVVALFGLALSVDYSLLMVNRFREERGAGHRAADAAVRAVEAAGRTITYSALTVMASLAGLFAFGDPTFTSLAVGGIATTLIALLTGLFLIPALLAVWGPKIRPEASTDSGEGAFAGLARLIQRRPAAVAAVCAMGLAAMAVPFLSVNYGSGDPRLLPRSFESRAVAETLLARFPGKQAEPIMVVAQRPAGDPAVRAYTETIKSLPGVTAVSAENTRSTNLSVIDVVPAGATQSAAAQDVVRELRVGRPGYRTFVTGSAAFLIDFRSRIATRLPRALLLIGLATFVLLFLMTGSVLVPLKALLMNALSLGATFGALVWVFQDGHLSRLLGFESFGAIEAWVPVVVFVFAFGLSMDYEVFLLSRVKERYDQTGDSGAAVVGGLQRSGRIITSAALLVMIVFLGFALGQNLGIKQMGLALAVAVTVDATVVRCLLVPATMTLLGDKNWWAPGPLRRLHDRYGLHEAPIAAGPHVAAARDDGIALADAQPAADVHSGT